MKEQFIEKQDYYIHSRAIECGFDYIERFQLYKTLTKKLDIYSDYWMLYIFDLPYGRLKMRHGRKFVDIVGPTGVFIPPFSPVEWHFSAGPACWMAYYCHHPVEPFFPQHPISFAWDPTWKILRYDDVADLLRKTLIFRQVGVEVEENAVTRKTRLFLNRYFAQPLDIQDMAADLKIPYSTMACYFKKDYGVTTVAYRSTLRVFEAMKLIGQGQTIADSCYAAGFSDYSRFYRNFTGIIDRKPSDFLYQDNFNTYRRRSYPAVRGRF